MARSSAGRGRLLRDMLGATDDALLPRFALPGPSDSAALAPMSDWWWGAPPPGVVEIPLCWAAVAVPIRHERPINQQEVTQYGGPTALSINAQSYAEKLGYAGEPITLETATAMDAPNLAHFTTTQRAQPQISIPRLTFDLLPMPDSRRRLLLGLRIGQRIRLTGVPDSWPPSAESVLIAGISQEVGFARRRITFTTAIVPGGDGGQDPPWFRLGTSRLGVATQVSQLAAAVNSTATSLQVTSSPLWPTNPAAWPFTIVVDRELMTVVAVGQQLNSNASFEPNLSIAGWNPISAFFIQADGRHARFGLQSMDMRPNGVAATAGAESDQFAVSGGQNYVAVAWLRSTIGYPSAGVSVNWWDAAGAAISTSFTGAALAAGVWTLWNNTYAAPANAASASLVVTETGTPPGTARLNIDEVRLLPESTMIGNPQTLTVVRGVGGTTARVHALGAVIGAQPYLPF